MTPCSVSIPSSTQHWNDKIPFYLPVFVEYWQCYNGTTLYHPITMMSHEHQGVSNQRQLYGSLKGSFMLTVKKNKNSALLIPIVWGILQSYYKLPVIQISNYVTDHFLCKHITQFGGGSGVCKQFSGVTINTHTHAHTHTHTHTHMIK